MNSMFKMRSSLFWFKPIVSVPLTIILLFVTVYLLVTNNNDLLKMWYIYSMSVLLFIRICEFIEIKYTHFLLEFCYYINILYLIFLYNNINTDYLYPILHGPLILYSIIFGDTIIPHKLSKTLTFALHTYGAIVSWKLNNPNTNVNIDFNTYFKKVYIIYLSWFLFYMFYLFNYDDTSKNTTIRYMLKLEDIRINISFLTKLNWLIGHLIIVLFCCYIGILSKYYTWFDNSMMIITISVAMYNFYKYYKKNKHLLTSI